MAGTGHAYMCRRRAPDNHVTVLEQGKAWCWRSTEEARSRGKRGHRPAEPVGCRETAGAHRTDPALPGLCTMLFTRLNELGRWGQQASVPPQRYHL